jgi:hypothetical protein
MEPVQFDVTKLLEVIDQREKENNLTVRIPIEEYLKLKKSYDEYQTKEYKIALSLNHRHIMEEDGSTTMIGSIHTETVSFPDDTHTELSTLYNEVHANVKYLEHLEKKVEKLTSKIVTQDGIIGKLKDEISWIKKDKPKWWKR